jgi:hypothetical protein
MSFKLIAIRPLQGCDIKFLKNLKEEEIYKFYNDYKFILDDKEEDVIKIEYNSSVPENLYDQGKVKINISAIVGKNGSGKSSLVEFLLYQLFVISNNPKYINPDLFLDNQLDKDLYDSKINEIKNGLIGEFYYLIDNRISSIRIKKNIISKNDFILQNDKIIFIKSTEIIDDVKDIKEILPFFFSIIINFSFYSFNTNIIGLWIKAFFHKNDGYQLPVVISPYRDKGIMDVNIELFLTTARLVTNLLTLEGYDYINNKKIEKIFLGLNTNKDFSNIDNNYIIEKRESIFKPLFNSMFNNEFEYPNVEIGNDSYIKKFAEKYLDNKLRIIPQRYPAYYKYRNMTSSDKNYKKKCLDFLKDLVDDRSHVTLKVRQTLNFLRENIFNYTDQSNAVILNLSSIKNKIDSFRDQKWFTETIDYTPPPFLVPRILFEDESYFSDLSSGEQQKAFSVNSIIYHIKNIDSAFDSLNINQIKYESINLILDEIELYYHPEFQKSFINNLLNNIKEARFERIKKINILFLTHSPFILSDIPKQNILYLKNEETEINEKKVYLATPQDYKTMSSFGANITDLLADSFFIEDGLIGDFAKGKINNVIDFLNKKESEIKTKEEAKQIIEIIDEPLVKYKLKEMYLENIIDNDYIDAEIERLNNLKVKSNG